MPELLAALDAFVQEHRRCGEQERSGTRRSNSMSQPDDLLHGSARRSSQAISRSRTVA
jgi:hypothetical protein